MTNLCILISCVLMSVVFNLSMKCTRMELIPRKGTLRPRYNDDDNDDDDNDDDNDDDDDDDDEFATPPDVFQILIPAFFTQLYVPEKSEVLYFVVIVLGGLGTSVALLMPW